jgi:molybdopterin-guanine dinucleotide biosynthesis protein A
VLKDPAFQDDGPNYEGPLAGIQAGLMAATTPWIATVPCDCPKLPEDIVVQLTRASDDDQRARFVIDHPTFSLIPISSLKALNQFLQHGQRKLGQWFIEINAVGIPAGDHDAFRNLNSPEDLR